MSSLNQDFSPDYAVPPGWVLEERLEALEMSHAEFARRCGRSAKLISQIINGKAPVEPETAIQFEHVLGVDARIWVGLESDYQLHTARTELAEEAATPEAQDWYAQFPIQEMAQRNVISRPKNSHDGVSQLLSFFGVGTLSAWSEKHGSGAVAFRRSPSFKSDAAALSCWLREGELCANAQDCVAYDAGEFKRALAEVRTLTRADIGTALPKVTELCNSAGVSFALVKEYKKISLSGAARWLNPRKALIQLSARHKSDDHLWFSFFHEAAHLLLHSKKEVFIDGVKSGVGQIEDEANEWAANFLVPSDKLKGFVASGRATSARVRAFANAQEIAPGIVVGMLQHQGVIPWSQLNTLKVRYAWTN